MQKFTDISGREWRLSINAATVQRVRDELGLDLYEYGMHNDGEDIRQALMFRVRGDPILLSQILFALCRRQAEPEADWEDFCESLCGDRLWQALRAMEEEIVNFTPNPDQRDAVRAAIGKMAELMDATHAYVRAKTIEAIQNPQLDQRHASALREFDARFGKMLESLGSGTQDPTPTAS